MALAATVVALGSAAWGATEPVFSLVCKPYAVYLNANGAIVRIERPGSISVAAGEADEAGTLAYGATTVALEKPVERKASDTGCTLTYQLATTPALKVQLFIQLRQGTGDAVVLSRELTISTSEKLAADLTVKLPLWPALDSDSGLPLFNGSASALGNQPGAAYQFAGTLPGDGVRLAIPMVSGSGGNISPRVTIAADPYFSTLFTRDHVEWTYPKHVGLENNTEKRTVVAVFHDGAATDSVQTFFAEALPDVPAGPQWLHEIAMVDYDYMSDGGKGWFADIDALTKALPREDRAKVFLCLHAWYDWVGRYSFDAKRKKFDDRWTAFGNYARYKDDRTTMNIDGDNVDGGFAKCVPVELTIAEVRRRLDYAKSRGFRVGMYFADGVLSGTALADFSQRCVLSMGGWQGPDTPGDAYCQNPLAPEVRQFFLAYTDALLTEFGHEVDAFVWDETFMVRPGSLGSAEVPGYADRAMMQLVREVARKIEDNNHRSNRQTALLTSDGIGVWGEASYAMMAHGTYQDTHCQPQAWSYGIFPNYRNVVWSCCWWPVSKWKWIEFGVRQYQAPVAISNGWGDNVGFAELPTEMQQAVLTLFQWRKQKTTQLKILNPLPTYPRAQLRSRTNGDVTNRTALAKLS